MPRPEYVSELRFPDTRTQAMKTDHRHDLKKNDLAEKLTNLEAFVGLRAKALGIVAVAALVIAVIAVGALAFRNRSQSRGQDLLAEALVALDARVVPANATGEPG